MQALKQEIRKFIIDNFYYGQDDAALTDGASFLENGIIDSTGVLELVSFVQEQYKIRVSDDELVPENLDSLDNLARFVSRKRSGA
jgi:acyl carrier protein